MFSNFSWKKLNINHKLLLGNCGIIFLWVLLGLIDFNRNSKTYLSLYTDIHVWIFFISGAFVSVWINYLLIKICLFPVHDLSETMNKIAQGNYHVRAASHMLDGSTMKICADSLNNMLEVLEKERARASWLAEQVIRAQEEERKRIARELHDDTIQALTFLEIRLENHLSTCSQGEFDQLVRLTRELIVGLRRLTANLRPTLLEDIGLRQALFALFREQIEKRGMELMFEVQGTTMEVDLETELALYRITQEIICNIVKHARATAVKARLRLNSKQLELKVSDNGNGFDSTLLENKRKDHLGIRGIQERTSILSGKFNLHSYIGSGTTVEISLPIKSSTQDLQMAK